MFPLEFRRACFTSPLSLCVFALAIIVSHAQNFSGPTTQYFISIDCGLYEVSDYNDENTGIPYSSDSNFIDSGENHGIAGDYISDSLDRHLWTVRSFPHGLRHCYDLSAAQGKGKKYLIRATFLYGNYDSKNQPPKFDLHLGVELWDTVEIKDSNVSVTKEIAHVSSSNYIYVCLVDTGTGTPFISALELRPVDPNAYPTNTGESLARSERWNFAQADTNKVIRYPDDIYDRLWQPYPTTTNLVELNTSSLDINIANGYQPPVVVMQTATTPKDASAPLNLTWMPPDANKQFYFYFHFAEVVRLQNNESRAFTINLKDHQWYETIVPNYLSLLTIYTTAGSTKATFDYSLVRTENSTLPPLINAFEVYSVTRFLQSQTDENDVWSILNIKSTYGVNTRNWQGDPCLPPQHVWEGLDCMVDSKNKSTSPRIKSLDLSNNSLNGPVPDFLADLPRLKVQNLLGNQFSGSIPQKLLDKAKNGLELRADGYTVGTPDPCQSGQCNMKKSKKFVVPLVVSLSSSLTILGALIVIWRLRRGKRPGRKLDGISNRKNGFLETRNIQFTYSDLLKITNNFQRVLGKGGVGTVHHGVANGKQVAVKLLSQSSAQGYNEFQTGRAPDEGSSS